MIITQTPFRISFFGGGTDYPVFYREHGGAVLAATIDKYSYITCRYLPSFFEHNSRIVYSKTELVQTIDEIQHPSVRECLRFMNIEKGIEIHHDADLPARSGLGSSSSFTVGFLQALHALKGKMSTKKQLALDAIHVEQNMIGESVGSQDQCCAAFGGFNKIEFCADADITVQPIILSKDKLTALEDRLIMVFTGLTRFASQIAATQISETCNHIIELSQMRDMVDEGISILTKPTACLDEFGRLLHSAWLLKRCLTTKISNDGLDDMYELGLKSGALGGKLLGAGGGGFFLFYVPPERRIAFLQAFQNALIVPFHFEFGGSQILHYRPV